VDQVRFADSVGVGPHRQGDDVGFQTIDDGAGLRRGSAVRLLDRDLGSRRFLVLRDEGLVESSPQLASRIVGDVQQLDGGGVRLWDDAGAAAEQQRDDDERQDGRAYARPPRGACAYKGPSATMSRRARPPLLWSGSDGSNTCSFLLSGWWKSYCSNWSRGAFTAVRRTKKAREVNLPGLW